MDVSVITVVYNGKNLIQKTLASVISQINVDFEYVVIDAESSDGTSEIIESCLDKVDVYIRESDSGIYDAMNKGVSKATGKWLLFMNCGDVFVDEKALSRLMAASDDSKVCIYGNTVICYDDGTTKLFKPHAIVDFNYGMPFNHQSCITKRSELLAYKYDDSLKIYADFHFYSRFGSNAFKYADTSVAIYLYDGISSVQTKKHFKELWRIGVERYGFFSNFFKFIPYRMDKYLRAFIKKIIPNAIVSYIRLQK